MVRRERAPEEIREARGHLVVLAGSRRAHFARCQATPPSLRSRRLSRPRRLQTSTGLAVAATAIALFTGCAGDYVGRTLPVRAAYQRGDYDRALNLLRSEEKGPAIDRLLVLLDKGMVLHAAGKWRESIAALSEADRLSQQLDVVSVSEEAVTLISNERERTYRGEDFEKLMISVLLALNYAELGQDEDALVEVRRVNERLRKMVNEEKKPYEQLAIARYVGGMLYEDQGNLDSAFIDYYEAYKLQPRLDALAEPLLRLAKATGRDDAYAELERKFPAIAHPPLGKNEGQLVVVVEAGLSPQKVTDLYGRDPASIIAIPIYADRRAPAPATVTVENLQQQTVAVTSLRDVAKVHLNDRIGRLLAKQLAGVVVKAGVASGVGALTKSKEVGALTFLLLSATNKPDLRSWLSLPAEFQLVRFRLPAGQHRVNVTGSASTSREVDVQAGRVSLVVLRQY